MRVHIAWPILFALIAAVFMGVFLYQRSWIPQYNEAERLVPAIEEFGRALAEAKSVEPMTVSTVRKLLLEDRFSSIQSYGVVFTEDADTLFTIRVNRRNSFDIAQDGTTDWNIK